MTFNKSKHRNLMVSDSRTGKEKSRINSWKVTFQVKTLLVLI
jgi:hypothetical protein